MTEQDTDWKRNAAALGAWLLASGLVLVDLFLFERMLLQAARWIGAHYYAGARERLTYGQTIEALDRVLLFVLGAGGLALAVAVERHYRQGIDEGKLARRIIRVTAILVGSGLLCAVVNLLIQESLVAG